MRSLENAYPQKEFIASKILTSVRSIRPLALMDASTLSICPRHYPGRSLGQTRLLPAPGRRRLWAGKNVGRGRIYRIRHRDHERGPRPQLLHRSIADLASYPSIQMAGIAYACFAFEAMLRLLLACGDGTYLGFPQGSFHALWTLDGLSQTTPELLAKAIQIRTTGFASPPFELPSPTLPNSAM